MGSWMAFLPFGFAFLVSAFGFATPLVVTFGGGISETQKELTLIQ